MEARIPGRLGDELSRCGRLLQVALDVTEAWRALNIAASLADLRGVVLEAGTPLIKAAGLGVARLLKALPGGRPVLADTKTVDTGALEVRLAGENGADAMTVLALAPQETIREAVRESRSLGIAVVGDLIGVEDPVRGAERLARLGVDVALLHVGIDVQRSLGLTAAQVPGLVEKVAKAFGGVVAVAGGIKPAEAGVLARAGASIVVIGGGILRAPDPRAAAEAALGSMGVSCG